MGRSSQVLGRMVLLGVVAGLRTQLPLALLAVQARRGRFAAGSTAPYGLLRSPAVLPILALSAAGELAVDKLPIAPSRLDPGPLFGRFLFGGLAGAAIAREADRSPLTGAMLGAAGAGLGAFAGYHLRVLLAETTGVPDSLWGVAEDFAALTMGAIASAE
jgi:uncharacterized membrane protein